MPFCLLIPNIHLLVTHVNIYLPVQTNGQIQWGSLLKRPRQSLQAIPVFAEVGWEITAEQTYEYAYGESHSKTIEVRYLYF